MSTIYAMKNVPNSPGIYPDSFGRGLGGRWLMIDNVDSKEDLL
jgi:hypothetical protein